MSKHTATAKKFQEPSLLDEELRPMKLLSLTLENFKGVRRFSLEPDGKDIRLLGENASGKTTAADSFSWLLFGKDSLGRSDFEIKTLDSSGEALHGLDHAVEAMLDTGDGQLTLRKVYREKWVKKRGSAEREFSGHEVQHFFDGVPIKESEYKDRIASIADEKVFRLLTNPIEFAERLHWQERRRILLEVCGDISDADVISSTPELADLSDILAGRSIDDQRKVATAQKRKVNEELQRVPIRIDEVSRNLPGERHDVQGVDEQLAALRSERRDAEAELSRIESGGEIAEKTKRLREIEGELLDEVNQHRAERQGQAEQIRAQLMAAQSTLGATAQAKERLQYQIEEAQAEGARLEARMATLRGDWHQVDAETFIPAQGDDVCAACGQKLPAERIEEARANALAEFNGSKAEQLRAIADEGKRLRFQADELAVNVKTWRDELVQAVADEKGRAESVAQFRQELERLTAIDQVRNPSDREYELIQDKRALQSDIEKLQNDDRIGVADAVRTKIETLNVRIVDCEIALSTAEQRRLGLERIDQLKRQERQLAGEYEELERQIYLLEEFIRRKVSLLTERINSKFELARWKLFNVLINGGVEECCEITYEGVPWSSLNTGSQVNIGLDVIRTLSAHYGIAPPIFCDHAESVTKLIGTPGQQIHLVVSDADKSLRMEETR